MHTNAHSQNSFSNLKLEVGRSVFPSPSSVLCVVMCLPSSVGWFAAGRSAGVEVSTPRGPSSSNSTDVRANNAVVQEIDVLLARPEFKREWTQALMKAARDAPGLRTKSWPTILVVLLFHSHSLFSFLCLLVSLFLFACLF